MKNSDNGRYVRRLKRKSDGFTSLELDNILESQAMGVHKIEDNDHRRFSRRAKRKPDDFTSLELSNILESQALGVHKVEDNGHRRFSMQAKRKPDDFTGLQLSNIVLKGQHLGVHEIEDNDNHRFIRPLKIEPLNFTGLQLSNRGFHQMQYNDHEDNEDVDDMDPQYKMFLKRMRVDGKFYALEVGKRNGVPVYLKYHVDVESDDEERELPTGNKISNGKKEAKSQLQARKDKRKEMGSHRNLRSVQGRERRDQVEHDEEGELPTRPKITNGKKEVKTQLQARKDNRKKMGSHRNLRIVQGRERKDQVEHDEDWELPTRPKINNGKKEVKTHLQARKDDRKKMGSPSNLRSAQGRERRNLMENDEDRESPTRRKISNGKKEVKTQLQARNDNRKKMGSHRNLRIVQGRERKDQVEHDEDWELPTRPKINNGKKEVKTHLQARKDDRKKMGSPSNLRSVQGRERRNLMENDEDRESPTRRKISNGKKKVKTQLQGRKDDREQMGSPSDLWIFQGRERQDVMEHGVDPCYQLFLNGIIKEDKYVFGCTSGVRVVYDEDEVGSSDSEIEVWDHAPYGSEGNPSTFVPQKRSRASGISEFRKKVMSILQRPFNQEEYEKLLLDIRAKKSVGHVKDLRSRPISFSTDGSTISYLDYHPDVEREINAVQHNRPKVLNILRGFFYWLENIANEGEGVFKPWLDESCRAVLPARL